MSVFANIPEPVRFALGTKGLAHLKRCEAEQAGTCLTSLPVFAHWFENFLGIPGVYLPLSDNRYREARNHLWNEYLGDCDLDPIAVSQTELFCNPLSYPYQHEDFGPGSDGHWWGPAPVYRTANGGICFITAEADVKDPHEAARLLGVQLAAMRYTKKPQDSLLGQFDRRLQQHKDYRGCCVVWSGNKSLHIIFAFATDHLTQGLSDTRHAADKWAGDIAPDDLKELYRHNAAMILADLRLHLGIDVPFDPQLNTWCQYRRMPGGTRFASAGNLFDIPKGTRVPQLVLFDLSRERAPKGATSYLFDRSRVPQVAKRIRAKRPKGEFDHDIHDDVLIRFQDACFAEWGTEYPKPVRIDIEHDQRVCWFANSPEDQNPSSVMRYDWTGLSLAGAHDFTKAFALPKPLIDYLSEFTEQANAVPSLIDLDSLTGLERRFHTADDADDCRKIFADSAYDLIAGESRLVMVQAPEGMGKTTSLLKAMSAQMEQERHPVVNLANLKASMTSPKGFHCFSVPSYGQQREKAKALEDAGMRVVLIESATHLHEIAADALGDDKITLDLAALAGEPGWWACVRAHQPNVIEEMIKMRDEAWGDAPFDPKQTVLVMVHAVTEKWMTQSPTRAIWHPKWHMGLTPEEEKALCDRMELSLIIFDEVDVSNLSHQVEWAKAAVAMRCLDAFKDQNPGISIRSKEATLEMKFSAWERGVQVSKDNPQTEGEAKAAKKFDFNNFISFLEIGFGQEDIVEIDTKPHQFGRNGSHKDIYQATNRDRFLIKPKTWFFQNPAKIIFLTTEAMPAAIARSISSGNESIEVHDLTRSPAIPRATIPLYVNPLVSKDQEDEPRLTALIKEKMQAYPGCVVISDNADIIPGSITHKSARGSNAYDKTDILAFYPMIPPDQYAGLIAVGQAYGIADPITVHYLDQLNQTCGRNQGYRGEACAAHEVHMHGSVYKFLKNSGKLEGNRYQLNAIKTAKAKRKMAA